MSEVEEHTKLLRQLTQRKRTVKKGASAASKPKEAEKAAPKVEENPLMKKLKSYTPEWMKRPKAKTAFDVLFFVGSCVVIHKFGQALHDKFDSLVPSEKDILDQMKAE